jgi:hypothetical protein
VCLSVLCIMHKLEAFQQLVNCQANVCRPLLGISVRHSAVLDAAWGFVGWHVRLPACLHSLHALPASGGI